MKKNKKLNLEAFSLISMIIVFIIMILIDNNIFNLPNSVQQIIVSIVTIFLLGLLVLLNLADSIGVLFLANFLLFYVLLGSATIINHNFFKYEFKPLKIYLAFFLFFLVVFFINTIIITVKLNILKEPTQIALANKKK